MAGSWNLGRDSILIIRLTKLNPRRAAVCRLGSQLGSTRPGYRGKLSDPIDREGAPEGQSPIVAPRNAESPAGFDSRDDGCDAWAGFLAANVDPILTSKWAQTSANSA